MCKSTLAILLIFFIPVISFLLNRRNPNQALNNLYSDLPTDSKKNVTSMIILIALQIITAIMFLKVESFSKIFDYTSIFFAAIQQATEKGVSFVLGGISRPEGIVGLGFMLMIHALPVLILISALSSALMHLKILPFIINIISFIITKLTGISRKIGICASSSFFFGVSESPIVLRQYLPFFKSNHLLTLMVIGMSIVAPSMIGVYSSMYSKSIPNLMQYLCTATVLNIIGALWIVNPMKEEEHNGLESASFEKSPSFLTAVSNGILIGAKIVVIISAIMIGFVAFIELIDIVLKNFIVNGEPLKFSRIFGWIFTPIAMLLGADDPYLVGSVIGIKIGINEFVAFQELSNLISGMTKNDAILSVFCISNFGNIATVTSVVGTYTSLITKNNEKITGLSVRAFYLSLLNTFFVTCVVTTIIRLYQ